MDTAPAPEHPDTTDTGAGGHRFTLTSAADACNTSKRTLLRHMTDLTRHGATKDDTGAWSIPLGALLAAGFRVNAPRTTDTDHTAPKRAPERTEVDQLRTEIYELRTALAVAQAERAAAERIAAERAEHLDTARLALRQLTTTPLHAPQPAQTVTPDAQPPQRRWWRFRSVMTS